MNSRGLVIARLELEHVADSLVDQGLRLAKENKPDDENGKVEKLGNESFTIDDEDLSLPHFYSVHERGTKKREKKDQEMTRFLGSLPYSRTIDEAFKYSWR